MCIHWSCLWVSECCFKDLSFEKIRHFFLNLALLLNPFFSFLSKQIVLFFPHEVVFPLFDTSLFGKFLGNILSQNMFRWWLLSFIFIHILWRCVANGFITILLVKKLRNIGLQIHVNQDLGTPLANALAALSFQKLGVLLYLISMWLWARQWFRFPYLC